MGKGKYRPIGGNSLYGQRVGGDEKARGPRLSAGPNTPRKGPAHGNGLLRQAGEKHGKTVAVPHT